ncbi:MAG: hypothetical protein FJW37_03810 [Acidobacteria bacterium]|nr:hypothetical protein [Acidobacteriota bacterium]
MCLSRAGDPVTCQAEAINLSGQGVYWISKSTFTPGERLHCSIRVPQPGFGPAECAALLECEVVVVRLEDTPAGFGVGGRIEKFRYRGPGAPHGRDPVFPSALQSAPRLSPVAYRDLPG